MAYVSHFADDIFVSYARVDNEVLVDDGGQQRGWVDVLVDKLRRELVPRLGGRDVSFVIDHEFAQSNLPLTPQIVGKVQGAATLLVVMSPSYLGSEWCGRERAAFLSLVRDRVATGSILLVRARPVPRDDEPEELRDLLGIELFTAVEGAGSHRLLGDPDAKERPFVDRIITLAGELEAELKRLRAQGPPAEATPSAGVAAPATAAGTGSVGPQPSAAIAEASILDAPAPFPWSHPRALELLDLLQAAYPDIDPAAFVARQVPELRTGEVPTGQGIEPYWRKLLEAAAAQGKLPGLVEVVLKDPRVEAYHARLREAVAPPGPPPPRVFVARSTDDVDEEEKALRAYLTQADLQVLPSAQSRYPTTDLAGYEAAVLQDLAGCCLFAQVLGALPGKALDFAPDKRLPALQHDLAVRAGKPVLQWRNRSLQLDDVQDPQHRALLDGAQACGIEEFKRTVAERARRPPPPPPAAPAPPTALALFVNADTPDLALAKDISNALAEEDVDCYWQPEQGSPEEIRTAMEDNLLKCDGLVLVYGKTKLDWVQQQLRQVRKMTRDRPLSMLAVFRGPPPEKPDIGVSIKNLVMLDCCEGLEPAKIRDFVDRLRK